MSLLERRGVSDQKGKAVTKMVSIRLYQTSNGGMILHIPEAVIYGAALIASALLIWLLFRRRKSN
jgi:hypothetical protein